MTDLRKKALWMSLIGSILGLGIGLLLHVLSGPEGSLSQESDRPYLLLYLLLSSLYGAVNMGTSALYGVEDWSILRCTFTHFAICVTSSILFFGALILFGWMKMPSPVWSILLLAAYVAVYCLIWLLQYLSYRRKVKQMNAKLRQWKANRKD